MSRRDYAIAPNDNETALVLHRIDCPKVREQAARGQMVMTMLQCENEPEPDGIERHSCLDDPHT